MKLQEYYENLREFFTAEDAEKFKLLNKSKLSR
jgi:hypothetical protein